MITIQKKRPAISNLVLIYSEFSGLSTSEVVKKFKGVNYVEFKKDLAEVVIKSLKPIQERRKKLASNKSKVIKILQGGAKKARPLAQKTMAEVKKRVGLL